MERTMSQLARASPWRPLQPRCRVLILGARPEKLYQSHCSLPPPPPELCRAMQRLEDGYGGTPPPPRCAPYLGQQRTSGLGQV